MNPVYEKLTRCYESIKDKESMEVKKRIAIITGASGGIGREFTRLMVRENVDEIWAIARNQTKLVALKKELGDRVIAISKDLSDPEAARSIENMLIEEKPVVAYLINNAGVARMGSYSEFTTKEIEEIISVNCSAVATLCAVCIPFMQAGSRILKYLFRFFFPASSLSQFVCGDESVCEKLFQSTACRA